MSDEKKYVDIEAAKKEKKKKRWKDLKETLKKVPWMQQNNSRINARISLSLKIIIAGFIVILCWISGNILKKGDQFSKIVLSQSQQRYGSTEIPFKRGDIRDKNGAVFATSEKVYDVILDCKVVNSQDSYRNPTADAVEKILGIPKEEIFKKLDDPDTEQSQYQIMKKEVPFSKVKEFEAYKQYPEIQDKKDLTEQEQEELRKRNSIKGIWFEQKYQRVYPMNEMASDLIGFTYSGDVADWGIEGFYSDTLNGTNGRKYGYYNEDAYVEQNLIEPVNGNHVITTIDMNIQKVVEKYIQKFMDGMGDEKTGKEGAENVGVIVMNPNNGQILAMASDNPFDLNNPRDMTPFYTEEEIEKNRQEDTLIELYSEVWKNYCISESYEPGSTVKPLTIAGALQGDFITKDMEFTCDGSETFGKTRIRCAVYPGAHGTQTLSEVMKNSCNDALMEIARMMGPEEFLEYQKLFNFGYKTGIDLPGEATGILHNEAALNGQGTELASASFGQGYTCTMIQEIAAIASVINGGYYYKPYVVSKIVDEKENVVEYIDPVIQKQTVSSDVSALIREYMGAVCEPGGTGYAAKIDGYSMGGKTGTAQKYPRKDNKYLVSYIGFAPLENPQVLVYVVVDEANSEKQSDSKFAQYIARGIMTEILPYMNIFPDEELTNHTSSSMMELEAMIEAHGNEQNEGADNPNLPAPPEDEEVVDLHNKREDQGITNQEAGLENSQ